MGNRVIFVTYRYERSSGRTALEIQSADKTVLAESCGSNNGSLDFSNLKQDGGGFFTVGDKTFEVLSNPKDGAVCTRVYDDNIAVVECTGVDFDVPEGVATSAADCFSHEDNKAAFRSLKSRSENLHLAGAPVEQPTMPSFHSRILGSRQACMFHKYKTKLVGDGNPHQNYLHKQLSENAECGTAVGCGTGAIKSTSYTIGFSSSASTAGWISGGFDVSKSWTTGNSYNCDGRPGETICIWYNTAHTAYTVTGTFDSACGDNKPSEPYVLQSPNKSNRGGSYYCVVGTCRAMGDQYWDLTGRAGGP